MRSVLALLVCTVVALFGCDRSPPREKKDAVDEGNADQRTDPTAADNANRHNAVDLANRGVSLYENKDYDKAITELSAAIRLRPDYVLAYFFRAISFYEKKDYDRAIADLDAAIRIDPKNAVAYYRRANCWLGKKEFDKAIDDCNESVRLDPEKSPVYNSRGMAWRGKKQFDKAIGDFSEVIRLDPAHTVGYYNRATCWVFRGEDAKAKEDFEAAIRLDPNDHLSLDSLALLLAASLDSNLRDGKRAVELAKRALALAKHEPIYMESFAAAHAECGDFEQAIQWQERALEKHDATKRTAASLRLERYRMKQPCRLNRVD